MRLIEEHHSTRGCAPSIRELQVAAGISSMATLHRDLVALRAEGLIEWDPHHMRTIRVVADR